MSKSARRVFVFALMRGMSENLMANKRDKRQEVWVGVYVCVLWDAVVIVSHVLPCSVPVDGGTGEASS